MLALVGCCMDNKELENINLAGTFTNTYAGEHLAKQIIRSGTSSALNYEEALAGESRRDFTHKIKVVLKELRETLTTLRIVQEAKLCSSSEKLGNGITENNELISIFVQTVNTIKERSKSQVASR